MPPNDASSHLAALKATLLGGVIPEGTESGTRSISGTLRSGSVGERPLDAIVIDGTIGMPEGKHLHGETMEAELENAINKVRDGWIPVKCHETLGKRAAHGFARWIENHVALYTYLVLAAAVALPAGVGFALWRLVHAFL